MSGPEPGPLCTTISIGLVGLNVCADAGAVPATIKIAAPTTTTALMADFLPLNSVARAWTRLSAGMLADRIACFKRKDR
jgi:hypothetical protein